jgi:hypothetical protein
VIRGDKELVEKLGGNDPCPCGSGRRFQTLVPIAVAVVVAFGTVQDQVALRWTPIRNRPARPVP